MHDVPLRGNVRNRSGYLMKVLASLSCTLFVIGCQTNEPTELNANPNETPIKTIQTKSAQADTTHDDDAKERRELYERHCAGCHGTNGDGKGYASWLLFPKPRNFGQDQFRLVSSQKRIPTLKDVEIAIARGMPGSAMLPWSHLGGRERTLLAREVLRLRKEGLRQSFVTKAEKEEGGELDEEALEQLGLSTFMKEHLESGPAVAIPEIGEPDKKTLDRGKFLYFKQSCHMCHGNEGRGDGQKQMIDDYGLPTEPRDFTRGIFKGRHDPASVYLRIALGMPGTPMPSSGETLSPGQMTDVTHYVLSMSNEDLRRRAVLRREKLFVKFVDALPDAPDNKLWADVPPNPLRMTPLWWRNGADPDLEVQAVHDGKKVALRLAWRDETRDDGGNAESKPPVDGAALELYRGDNEPFIGLGSPSPVEVWYWRADSKPTGEPDEKATAIEGFKGTEPGGMPPLPWEGNSNKSVRTFVGSGTVTFEFPRVRKVDAQSEWNNKRWTVVMSGPMKFDDKAFTKLQPGESVSIAFAIWNGAFHDEGGKKAITIWHDLVIEDLD